MYVILIYPTYYDRYFFFQAEVGIRDIGVTGVQTCALPICMPGDKIQVTEGVLIINDTPVDLEDAGNFVEIKEIGRASCRERV